jgi:adenylosuccinate synthase
MPADVVLGLQWGDEGKGKIVDLLAEKSDYVVRFQGGNNAGHTVVIGDKKYFFRLIPSGAFHKRTKVVISNGVVLDPEVLVGEINLLINEGLNLKKKLIISKRCHLILPYHKKLDEAYENARGTSKLGTTLRGIGPAYADKVSYNGIRVSELQDWKHFKEIFSFHCALKNKILTSLCVEPINLNYELEKIYELRKTILPYIADAFIILNNELKNKKRILLEGAHGIMLDTDWSPYPFSTASNTVIGAANTGAGIPYKSINRVIGVVKAFTSRVGSGPLPTEINSYLSNRIREYGAEYGTTTGRPRRIGWLDLEAVKFSCNINNVNMLAITKLDILSTLNEIKVCTAYEYKGKSISYSSCSANDLFKLKPVYKLFPGWKTSISGIRKFKDLPKECIAYIKFISTFLRVPVKLVSVGAERNANITK